MALPFNSFGHPGYMQGGYPMAPFPPGQPGMLPNMPMQPQSGVAPAAQRNSVQVGTSEKKEERHAEDKKHDKKQVLVTGGTGYVGAWCVHELLQSGHMVSTTVRDPHGPKAEFLRKLVASGANLKIHKADLLEGDEVWQPLMAGVEIVLHVASPFPLMPPKKKMEHLIVDPAVKGTRVVLENAMKAGVKRIVLTSSIVAISEPQQKGKVYTPADWSSLKGAFPYQKSKILAEQKAWELAKQYPKTELCVVAPGLVFGPSLPGSNTTDFASSDTVRTLLRKEFPVIPNLSLGTVDVRDVAACHVRAAFTPEAAGKRLLAAPEAITLKQMINILHERWPKRGLSTPQAPKWMIALVVPLDPKLAQVYTSINNPVTYDCSDTVKALGITFRPIKDAILLMAEELVDDVPAPGCATKLGLRYATHLCCGPGQPSTYT